MTDIENFDFFETDLPVAVVVSRTKWDEPPRIRHQLTRQLRRFYNVIYVEFPCGPCMHKTSETIDKIGVNAVRYVPDIPFIVPEKLYLYCPPVHGIVNKHVTNKIVSFMKRAGLSCSVLMNFNFDYPEICGINSCLKVYLCNDEIPDRVKFRPGKTILKNYEKEVIRKVDMCITVSDTLNAKLKEFNKNVYTVFPGHEFEPGLSRDVQKNRTGRIEVCYMGYINGRLCLDWFRDVLRQPDMDLRLVGPVTDVDLSDLESFDNFELIPPLEGEKLQSFLASMDVLVMPYDVNLEGVKHSSVPNKLFQYIACGKPIVISDMPNFVKLPEKFLYKAGTGREFVEMIRKAYEEDSTAIFEERLTYAGDNTWEKRGDSVYSILQENINKKLRIE